MQAFQICGQSCCNQLATLGTPALTTEHCTVDIDFLTPPQSCVVTFTHTEQMFLLESELATVSVIINLYVLFIVCERQMQY